MCTLFVGFDKHEAVMATDSSVTFVDNKTGNVLAFSSGAAKIWPLSSRVLFSAVGDSQVADLIVREIIASGDPVTPRSVAEFVAQVCEPLSGQKRLQGFVLGSDADGFVCYAFDGHDASRRPLLSKGAVPSLDAEARMDDLPVAPYRPRRISEKDRPGFATLLPGCDWFGPFMQDMFTDKGNPMRKVAAVAIVGVARTTEYQGHDDRADVWILPREGRARKVL